MLAELLKWRGYCCDAADIGHTSAAFQGMESGNQMRGDINRVSKISRNGQKFLTGLSDKDLKQLFVKLNRRGYADCLSVISIQTQCR
ncbi:MAG: hypothetical protein NWS69_10020 [Pseudomonadales bacterium]|nr:hypothetical protein [Pseudomonadales bacterium]